MNHPTDKTEPKKEPKQKICQSCGMPPLSEDDFGTNADNSKKGGKMMGIGERLQNLRILNGLTQEQLAEKLNVSRQSVSKWEMNQSVPETEKIIMMSRLFSVETDRILLDEKEIESHAPQQLHLGSIYLIVRDFERAVSFYEKLLSMPVSTRNCGNRFAEFYFDNKCLALMNEKNLEGHCYKEGDYKFVLNFWVEDLQKEYERIRHLNIGEMTEIRKVHEGYYYFHLRDADDNVIEITGGFHKSPDRCG